MKNHELLDMIGEADEDYVRAADENVVRPRFGWKKLAVCAACGLLVLGVYSVYRAVNPPLHSYTVLEGSGAVGPEALLGGGGIDTPGQNAPGVGGEHPIGDDPNQEYAPDPAQTGDVSAQWRAIAQYQRLLQGMGGQGGGEPEPYPDWYGGAWIDDAGDRLAVAIVDGFHTGELEARIEEWCGGEVVFVQDMKYSYAHLLSLNDQVLQALQESLNQDDAWSALSSIVPDMMANCLAVSFSGTPSDAALAFLARLDPAGDAIRVRAFTDKLDILTDDEMKGSARARAEETTPASAESGEPVPGGGTQSVASEPPQGQEQSRPAEYDLLYGAED